MMVQRRPQRSVSHVVRLAIPYLVLFVAALVFFRHVLFYEGYVIPWDLRYDHFPVASFVAESFAAGELPLWDPYTFCGRPLYANIQAQVFYPPTAATLLLSNALGGDRLLYALEWHIVLHVILGGIGCYLLLCRLGTSRAAALAGGILYELGAFFASQAQHLGAVDAAGWLPFTWLAVVHLGERLSLRWAIALAATLAMTVLAGLPSMTAVVYCSVGLLSLALVVFRLAPPRLLTAVLGAVLWSLLLSAIQLLPTNELTWQSIARYRDDWLGSGGGLPLESLVSLILPNYYGVFDRATFSLPYDPTFVYLYGSLVGLALCVVAVIRRRRYNALFGVFTLLCALWMLGDSTPLGAALFAVLPGYIQIGLHPEFAGAAFCLSYAVLAGLGADLFRGRPFVAYGLVALAAVDLIVVSSGREMNAFPTSREPGVHAGHFDGHPELLDTVRGLVNASVPPWRLDTAGDSLNWASTATVTQAPSANGNDPFAPARVIQARLAFARGERWGRYFEVEDLASPVVDLMNVRYILSRAPLEEDRRSMAGLVHLGNVPGRELYENPEALPRFFLAPRVKRADSLEQAVEWLRDPSFDPRKEAIVEGDVEPWASEGPASEGTVSVAHYGNRRIVLEVSSPARALLVASETHYPGWVARVDGREAPILHANVAFRGVEIPPGRHTVEMEFSPRILTIAAILSSAGWLLLIVGGLPGVWRRVLPW